MLPSSHQSPIISPMQGAASFGQPAWSDEATHFTTQETPTTLHALALAEAFADFVSTSSRLEQSYRELQGEVAALHRELGQRNEDLKLSFAENQRVRFALQQVIDSMPCGVVVADASESISTINPEVARLLGSEALDGLATLSALNERTGLKLQCRKRHGLEVERECRIQSSAGERWLQVRERALTSSNEASVLTIFIVSDITAQKRAERDREAARNAMVLAEITTMLAHEIRNPLASLELFAELIEQDGAQRDEWISNLRAGIRSLSGTVNNVLSMHETRSLRLRPLSLNDTIESALRFVEPVAKQAGVLLECVTLTEDVKVLGNDGALQQVLLNLIRNAIRHTPSGGTVTLSLEKLANERAEVSCSDTGSGMRADQIGRIFESGFSGNGDTPGLGLAVCARIMRQHRAEISASNLAGCGARFLLSFPSFDQEFVAA